MRVALGADHAGFQMKNAVADHLRALGHNVLDLGADSAEPSDYPDFAEAAAAAGWAPPSRRTSFQESGPACATTPTRPTRVWSTTT